LSFVRDGPGRPRMTGGFALNCFFLTGGFIFGTGFRWGSGGGGSQGDSAVRGSLIAVCGVEGNGDLVILGAGAGIEIVVDWIVAMGLGKGTVCGGWAKQRLSITLATRVMIATSSSDIAARLLMAIVCWCMLSSRCW